IGAGSDLVRDLGGLGRGRVGQRDLPVDRLIVVDDVRGGRAVDGDGVGLGGVRIVVAGATCHQRQSDEREHCCLHGNLLLVAKFETHQSIIKIFYYWLAGSNFALCLFLIFPIVKNNPK
ncbi:MAG TPA: hypothetical protein DEB09_00900, partial [Candidatus Magasanikbacteria bacterium]|nr:hypothetical protein [Candidatus Magasanikbacteria bacterium]